MQKETCSASAYPVRGQDNVLLTRSSMLKRRRAKNIVTESQFRAKKIVKEALQEAENIRKESYLMGYERGLLMGGDALAQFIDNSHRYAHELYLQLQKDIKTLLADVLNDEAALLKIVESWIDEVDKQDVSLPVSILMPYANRQFKANLLKLVSIKHPGGVIFEYHHEPRFVFKYKEKLAEFYVEEFIDVQIDELLCKRDLYADCHKISIEALNELHKRIASYLPDKNLVPSSSEDEFSENTYDN